ncbi:hypothetical protein FVE85_1663 [Porphyridium purpureum]|uniref:Uncharacterized protein n=1 Tax=Porphyridium purpureum TaxID=35688 RepID=A0A5J4YWJ3_PORPP|nr:hypothetical protein FVE85_1663 [Porphyridium purpureum]|eukprot:POR2072..scf209_3
MATRADERDQVEDSSQQAPLVSSSGAFQIGTASQTRQSEDAQNEGNRLDASGAVSAQEAHAGHDDAESSLSPKEDQASSILAVAPPEPGAQAADDREASGRARDDKVDSTPNSASSVGTKQPIKRGIAVSPRVPGPGDGIMNEKSTGTSATELFRENRNLAYQLEQQSYDLKSLEEEVEMLRGELLRMKRSNGKTLAKAAQENEVLLQEITALKKQRERDSLQLQQAIAENKDFRRLLENHTGSEGKALDLSLVGRANSVWNLEDLEQQLITSKMQNADFEMEIHVLRKERNLAEQRAIQAEDELTALQERFQTTLHPITQVPMNQLVPGTQPGMFPPVVSRQDSNATSTSKRLIINSAAQKRDDRVLRLLDVTEKYHELRYSVDGQMESGYTYGEDGEDAFDFDAITIQDEGRRPSGLPAGPMPRVLSQSTKRVVKQGSQESGGSPRSGSSYLRQKLGALPLQEPNLALQSFGDDFATDAITFYQNAMRKEMMDLYYIVNSLIKRQFFIGDDDFDLFIMWFELFRYLIFIMFQVQKVIMYPWICSKIDLEGGGHKEPDVLETNRNARRDRISLFIDSIYEVLDQDNCPHGERLGRVVKLVDKLAVEVVPLFNAEMRILPELIKKNFSAAEVEAYQMQALQYIRRVQYPHMVFLMLVDWVRDKPLREGMIERYLARTNIVTRVMWTQQFNSESKRFRREHSGVVRTFYLRWKEFEKQSLAANTASKAASGSSDAKLPESTKSFNTARSGPASSKSPNSARSAGPGHMSWDQRMHTEVNSTSKPL